MNHWRREINHDGDRPGPREARRRSSVARMANCSAKAFCARVRSTSAQPITCNSGIRPIPLMYLGATFPHPTIPISVRATDASAVTCNLYFASSFHIAPVMTQLLGLRCRITPHLRADQRLVHLVRVARRRPADVRLAT